MWLLAAFISLWAVGLRASISLCQLEAALSSLLGGHSQQPLVSSEPTRRRVSWWDWCYSCMHVITDLVTFAIFHWLEASHQSHLHSKGEVRAWRPLKGPWEATLGPVCRQVLSSFSFFLLHRQHLKPPNQRWNLCSLWSQPLDHQRSPSHMFLLGLLGSKRPDTLTHSKPTYHRKEHRF